MNIQEHINVAGLAILIGTFASLFQYTMMMHLSIIIFVLLEIVIWIPTNKLPGNIRDTESHKGGLK